MKTDQRLLIFSIYDSATEAYNAPFIQRARGEAIRTFKSMADNPESLISKRPDHFTLFLIGAWDDVRGVIEPFEAKESLGTALEWKEAQEQSMKVVRNA